MGVYAFDSLLTDIEPMTEEEMELFKWDKIRPIIRTVAFRAENKMRLNDPDKGDSWQTCEIEYLKWKLLQEVEEALDPWISPQLQADELSDVVAVCAMLAERLRHRRI